MAILSRSEQSHRFASMNARAAHHALGVLTGKMKPIPKIVPPPPDDESDQEPEATEE